MIKIPIYFIQSIFVYFFFLFGKIIGLSFSRKFFSSLFLFTGSFFKSKKIIHKNLEIFSKKLTQIEKDFIIKNMWRNYGMTFIEYIHLNYFKKNQSHIVVEGKNVLQEIVDGEKQAIFVSGHFANFELMSMEITKSKIPLATIYRPLNNFFLNPFMEYLRKKFICRNQIKKGINGVRDTIEFIKKKHSIALMIDQRVSEGEKINFFSKPALTTTLPAQLSMKFDLPIVPVFIERKKDNTFKLKFYEKISPNNFKDKIELSRKLNYILEEMIRKNPHQWIWTHNRWK